MNHQLLSKRIGEAGIGYGIYYPVPLHKQKAFKGYSKQKFPNSEAVAKEVVSIPIHPSLSSKELDTIVRALKIF
ncbi:MAG: DegT/DnrJ/EryC1/StrS family aminotransferase [Candidatus Woykebacteria bacterium]